MSNIDNKEGLDYLNSIPSLYLFYSREFKLFIRPSVLVSNLEIANFFSRLETKSKTFVITVRNLINLPKIIL